MQSGKSEHHNLILHIEIRLGIKFQLKLTISIFWTKFAQNGCFESKNRNFACVHGRYLLY